MMREGDTNADLKRTAGGAAYVNSEDVISSPSGREIIRRTAAARVNESRRLAPESASVATLPPLDLLLALDTHVLMGVVDAMLEGSGWEAATNAWVLRPGPCTRIRFVLAGPIKDDGAELPNPLGDGEAGDAAAYRMETRELCCIDSHWTDHGWCGLWWGDPARGEKRVLSGPWHPERRTAACLAVCHKYADHPDLGPLCRELITRLTSKENKQ